jgi:hypothetical protein
MSIKIFTTIGWIALLVVTVIAIVIVEVLWLARPAVPRGNLVTIENYLIQKLSQSGEPKLGSAALILIQNGEVVAAHPFGIANAAQKNPVEINRTLYQMASVSKRVTAWGVMKLVEEGTIHIEQLNRESQQRLNLLLLDEFSTRLGIKYEEAQLSGKAKKRLLTADDMADLKPFHWGYHFDRVLERGGFDAIITNPPWETFKPNGKELFAQYSDLVANKKWIFIVLKKSSLDSFKSQKLRRRGWNIRANSPTSAPTTVPQNSTRI